MGKELPRFASHRQMVGQLPEALQSGKFRPAIVKATPKTPSWQADLDLCRKGA